MFLRSREDGAGFPDVYPLRFQSRGSLCPLKSFLNEFRYESQVGDLNVAEPGHPPRNPCGSRAFFLSGSKSLYPCESSEPSISQRAENSAFVLARAPHPPASFNQKSSKLILYSGLRRLFYWTSEDCPQHWSRAPSFGGRRLKSFARISPNFMGGIFNLLRKQCPRVALFNSCI